MRSVSGLQTLARVTATVLCLAAVITAVSAWRLASETSERACIERAEAKYPAIPVSAFVTRSRADVGPLKVSYVRERTRAIDDC